MTGKQYFQRVLDADRKRKALQAQINHIEDMALRRPTLSRSGVHAASGNHSALELAVVRLLDTEKRLADQVDEYTRLIDEASNVIEKISDSKEQAVLRYRYLSGMRWEDVAPRVGYTLRQTFRLHGYALRSAEKIINKK